MLRDEEATEGAHHSTPRVDIAARLLVTPRSSFIFEMNKYELELLGWALKYDGYKRLGGDATHLSTVIQPLRESFHDKGTIPAWAGVDLLRGWAFFIARAYHHSGHGSVLEDYPELVAIVEAINQHPAARKSDRAPTAPVQNSEPSSSETQSSTLSFE